MNLRLTMSIWDASKVDAVDPIVVRPRIGASLECWTSTIRGPIRTLA